jgi:hypothetical protein
MTYHINRAKVQKSYVKPKTHMIKTYHMVRPKHMFKLYHMHIIYIPYILHQNRQTKVQTMCYIKNICGGAKPKFNHVLY